MNKRINKILCEYFSNKESRVTISSIFSYGILYTVIAFVFITILYSIFLFPKYFIILITCPSCNVEASFESLVGMMGVSMFVVFFGVLILSYITTKLKSQEEYISEKILSPIFNKIYNILDYEITKCQRRS